MSPAEQAAGIQVRRRSHLPRKYLAFFRAGHKSLHERLMREDPGRNWDCCVSWYTDPVPGGTAEYESSGGANKFEGFLRFLEQAGVPNYSYYFLLDDDLDFAPGEISRFFSICTANDLFVAQPSLRWGTNSSWYVTLHNPACRVRRTQSVEVMAPCFSRAALGELQCTFELSKSTFGIDIAWSALTASRPGALAVVDAVIMDHIKAMDMGGGAFYKNLESMGVNAQDEEARMRARYPGFYGGMPSLPDGHAYRFAGLPEFASAGLMRFFEKGKIYLHRGLRFARRWRKQSP